MQKIGLLLMAGGLLVGQAALGKEVPKPLKENPVAQENLKKLLETKQCPGCLLAGVSIKGKYLAKANLEGAELHDAVFTWALISDPSSAYGEEMKESTVLSGANLKRADLRGVKFESVDLADADLTNAIFDKDTSFSDSDLLGTKISKCALKEAGIKLGPIQLLKYHNIDKDPETKRECKEAVARKR